MGVLTAAADDDETTTESANEHLDGTLARGSESPGIVCPCSNATITLSLGLNVTSLALVPSSGTRSRHVSTVASRGSAVG
jgi:hypothetical protein